jgi:UDP:flavonoid glycosyltransferase YjiC (YdhE family)
MARSLRVLFSTPPGLGHFLPVVPLAWAVLAFGHEVRVVTSGAAVEAAASAGLPVVDICPDLPSKRSINSGSVDLSGSVNRINPEGTSRRQFTEFDDTMVRRAIHAISSWRPDLIVHTMGDFVAPRAASLHSIPLVLHGLGFRSSGSSAMTAPPDQRSLLRQFGLDAEVPHATAVLDTCPPSLREPDRPAAWPMRYIAYNGGGASPAWLYGPTSKPRVCVTLGTVVPAVAGVGRFLPIIDALSDLDVEVVLLLGDADRAPLGPLPDSVLTAAWLPLSELLSTCAVIIHHGGEGTTMSAIAAGIPQLVLDYRDATAVVSRGLGLSLTADAVESSEIRCSVEQLLHEPLFRRVADEVRMENSALPSPATVWSNLCELVVESRVARW